MQINNLLGRINEYIINPIILLAFAVALLVFFWGIVEFIYHAESSDGRETGRRNIVWGIVGMTVMVSVYAIIRLVLNTFGIPYPEYLGL